MLDLHRLDLFTWQELAGFEDLIRQEKERRIRESDYYLCEIGVQPWPEFIGYGEFELQGCCIVGRLELRESRGGMPLSKLNWLRKDLGFDGYSD